MKYVVIVLVVLCLFFTSCGIYTQKDIDKLNNQIALLEQDKAGLNNRIQELENKLKDCESRQRELRPFRDIAELEEFLANDDTDKRPYIPEVFDCDDFAITLMQNGVAKGYLMGLYIEKYYPNLIYEYHNKCTAEVYHNGKIWAVVIEPQADEYIFLCTRD